MSDQHQNQQQQPLAGSFPPYTGTFIPNNTGTFPPTNFNLNNIVDFKPNKAPTGGDAGVSSQVTNIAAPFVPGAG
jgi:hypothetical protein